MTDAAIRERLCACLRGACPNASAAPDMLTRARAEGILPIVAERLGLSEFAGELRAAAVIEALRAHELRGLLAALVEAGVRALLLKGAALAYTHYPRPELRPRADTDLMIRVADREAVVRVLTARGYRRPPEIDGDVAIGQLHLLRSDSHGFEHALDVHWRISNARAFADLLTYDELARDSMPVTALGPHAFSPSTPHALLIACIHRVAHHGDAPNLLWLYDIHLLERTLTPDGRDAFVALAAERGMTAVCARSLTLTHDAFGGVDAQSLDRL
jgi:hypothetical protein